MSRGTDQAFNMGLAEGLKRGSFDEYQQAQVDFLPMRPDKLTYSILGLAGEAGEVAEAYKKAMRRGPPEDVVMDYDASDALILELGDVLWYIAKIARELGVPLSEVARRNTEKIEHRVEHGK